MQNTCFWQVFDEIQFDTKQPCTELLKPGQLTQTTIKFPRCSVTKIAKKPTHNKQRKAIELKIRKHDIETDKHN